MKITHGIDLHDVNESRHHKQVSEEPHEIVSDITQKVKRSENNRDQEHTTHDNSTKYQEREVMFPSSLPLRPLIRFILHNLWVKSIASKGKYNATHCHYQQETE